VAHRGLALLSAIGLLGLTACGAGGNRRPYDETEMIDTLLENTRNGVVAPLDEERFNRSAASEGLWHPRRFIARSNPGIYFLEPYDPNRQPVLFVHGYDGSPRDFAYLIAKLDTTRFQAWVYNYPSGLRLPLLAEHLESSLSQLRLHYSFGCVSIVAHSMGGLVARGFLLRNATATQPQCIPLFVSISTPWEGSRAAAFGARWAPDLVSTWRDIASGSAYLRSLFAVPFPDNTRYYLVFTADDRTVTVASQLGASAKQEATQVIGYDATHVGVLRDAAAATGLLRLLEPSTQ
jgi:pimeloyl-ACP methyl ester carboxylesterase